MKSDVPEAYHRTFLRAGIGGLLALGLVPLTGFLGQLFQPLLESCRELFTHCLLALRASGAPLGWFPAAILSLGLGYAVLDRLRIMHKLDRLLARYEVRAPREGEPIELLARQFALVSRVRVLVGVAPNPAFTAGLLRPRIYVSQELQDTLTSSELTGVFRHEVCHLLRRDPLRFAGLRFLSKVFFWIPLLATWAEELMEDAEIVADDFAARVGCGSDPLDVASALVKLGRDCQRTLAGAVSIGGFRMLERRILRLAGEAPRVSIEIPMRKTFFSVGTLLVVWALTLVPPAAGGALLAMHPGQPCHHMPGSDEAHCPLCIASPQPRAIADARLCDM